ncbi:uncharacterized protein B0I36DRAFT_357294 [Microdochium trichocladiopsis]|uniref:Uncharacterized protein n=1 Tax=Microdochium trichocladiopsis TaxID=1682393 RepID=A0A9P8YGE9_9PEZI|nr:uncharacterized protein B0I36DRAFT_357294 [Microdochium trichocladiopsis]KAH7039919.1 hypothetical protein B0I36DRAFT_357294 [Microdochium trichocladiopsis]
MSIAPPTSINQHSISYLFTAYLGAANHYLDSGFSGVLETVVQKGKPPRYLSAAISATSIAAFSRRPNARFLAVRAEKVYSTALNEVNSALARPGSIDDDDLLAAILLLALYEVFMSDRFTGYYNHILGAAVILKHRQGRQTGALGSAVAAMAFILTRNEIMKSSILTPLSSIESDINPWLRWVHALGLDTWTTSAYRHLPASVMSGPIMHFKAMMYQAMEESSLTLTTPSGKISSLSPRDGASPMSDDDGSIVSDGQSPGQSPPRINPDYLPGLITALMAMYRRFANIDRVMSELYNVGPTPSQSLPDDLPHKVDGWDVFMEGPIHIYHNMLHAGFRLAMALAYLEPCSKATVIAMTAPGLDYLRETNEYQELEAGGRRAIAEIVGSVPYFCGLLPASMTGNRNSSSRHLFDVAGIRDAQAISFSTWAMAAGVMAPQTTGAEREYLLRMLRYCHEVKGLGQAAALHEACMEVVRKSATPHHATATSIPAAWMGRGTSLESLIYEASTPDM